MQDSIVKAAQPIPALLHEEVNGTRQQPNGMRHTLDGLSVLPAHASAAHMASMTYDTRLLRCRAHR
jgi:hypothetical protein